MYWTLFKVLLHFLTFFLLLLEFSVGSFRADFTLGLVWSSNQDVTVLTALWCPMYEEVFLFWLMRVPILSPVRSPWIVLVSLLVVSSQISLEGWSKLSQILERILLQVSMAHYPFLSPLLTWSIHQSLVSSFSGIPLWKTVVSTLNWVMLGFPLPFSGNGWTLPR